MPLRSWRLLSSSTRAFFAFPLAVLEGFIFPCALCGDCHSHITMDGNCKCMRYRTKGGDSAVYLVPNGPLIPEMLSTAALDAAPRPSSSAAVSSTCVGDSGESHWRAARPARSSGKTALDQHGLFALVCPHVRVLKLIAMTAPEACTREHSLALCICAALGADDALSDIVCVLLKSIRANGARNFSAALRSLSGALADAPVSVSVEGDGHFARFVLKRIGGIPTSEPGPRSKEFSGICPTTAAAFGTASLVRRLLGLIDAEGPRGLVIRCSIPALHQLAHQCRYFCGCSSTPSAGAGNEVCEWLFGRDFSPYASVARNMSAAQWRLYWNERGALSNQRKAAEDPLELLKFVMRAIILVKRREAELSSKRAAYRNQRKGGEILVTDAALSAAAQRRAANAAASSAAPKRQVLDSATATLRILKAQSSLRVLEGVRDDSAEYADRARNAFIATSAKESGFASIRNADMLEKKITSLQAVLVRLRKIVGIRKFDVNSIIVVQLRLLRSRAAELACNSLEIDRHRLEKSGRAVLAADRKIRGSILSAMHDLVDTIRVLVPLSTTPAVNRLVVPDIASIHGPDDLPARVGDVDLEPEDAKFQQLITAYLDLQGALSQLEIAKRSMRAAPSVTAAVSKCLRGMLSALVAPAADLQAGAGASGLFDNNPASLFDFATRLQANPELTSNVAAALAHHVYRGVQWWEAQTLRIKHVVDGLQLLLAPVEPAGIFLATDKSGRPHAYRYASALINGRLSPAVWHSRATSREQRVEDVGEEMAVPVGDDGGAADEDGALAEEDDEEDDEEEEDGVPAEEDDDEDGAPADGGDEADGEEVGDAPAEEGDDVEGMQAEEDADAREAVANMIAWVNQAGNSWGLPHEMSPDADEDANGAGAEDSDAMDDGSRIQAGRGQKRRRISRVPSGGSRD